MKTTYWREGYQEARRNPSGWRQVGEEKKLAVAARCDAEATLLKARGFHVQQRIEELVAALKDAPPFLVLVIGAIRGVIWAALASCLLVGTFSLLVMVFGSFGLRGYEQFAALAITVLAVAAVEAFLFTWYDGRPVPFAIASVFAVLTIVGILLLAFIRADLLGVLSSQAASGIDINGAAVTGGIPVRIRDYLGHSGSLLNVATPVLALAMELGAGLLLFTAFDRILSPDLFHNMALRRKRKSLEQMVGHLKALEADPQIFIAEFLSGGGAAESSRPVDQETRLAHIIPVVLLFIILLTLLSVWAAEGAELPEGHRVVVLVDLSQSSSGNEFEENVASAERILTQAVKPGAALFVFGITDNSFSHPMRILEAKVHDDPGYFGERLAAARTALVSRWHQEIASIKPDSKKTDLFGALVLVAQLRPDMLFILSDMRNDANGINMESPSMKPEDIMRRAEGQHLVANLAGANVIVLGTHAKGRNVDYWLRLESFWKSYFEKAGASLITFSQFRELP